MIPRHHIPAKADDGAELLVGLVLIGFGIFVIAALITMIIMVAIALVPTAGGIWWLAFLNRRFEITPTKKGICALIGVGLFLLPLIAFMITAPPLWWQDYEDVIAVLWVGTLLGFCGTALFLSIEAYRQVFWPHRKEVLKGQWKGLALRYNLWKAQWVLNRIQAALDRRQRENEHVLEEHVRLSEMVESLIRTTDAAFYGAERLRWQRECERMSLEALLERANTLNCALAQTAANDTRRLTLTLESAVVRLHAQDRYLGVPEYGTFQQIQKTKHARQGAVSELQTSLRIVQQRVEEENTAIQKLRRARPIVQ